VYKVSEPVFVLDISSDERKQAEKVRGEFKKLELLLGGAFESLGRLAASMQGLQHNDRMIELKSLFIKYKHKVQDLFNEFLDQLQVSLEQMNEMISDSSTLKIRDTIVGEVRELRDGALEVIALLNRPEDPTFLKEFQEIFVRLSAREKSLREIISDQLTGHIDRDILGKIKLGKSKVRLSKGS